MVKKAEIDEILMPGDPRLQEENEAKVKASFGAKFRKFAARLPFAHDMASAYYCALDPETPTRVRGILLAALAYFILPVDMVPDFLVGFGMTDDVAVFMAAYSALSGNIKDRHREAATAMLSDEKDTEKSEA